MASLSTAAAVAAGAAAVASHVRSGRKDARHRLALERAMRLSRDDVLIIGAGFSGICMGIKLREAGVPFRIIEKEADVGGTWFLNRYPNAACDIPSHLYSFSFDRNAEWTKPYSGQAEIQQYLRNVFDKHNLGAATQFNTALGGATWNEHTLRWDVVLSDGSERHPRFLINAIGGLHHPHVPDVPGVAEGVFEGESFHSAEWDATCDLRGKRVAVVGSAASAVQLVPTVAEQASELVLLQRTPNWVSSRWSPIMPNDRYTEAHKWVFRNVPGAERMHRWALYWMLESLFAAGVWDFEGRAQATAQRVVRAEMHKSLGGDQALIEKVVPTYGVGCKRICRADDYLPALCRDNVLVVPHGLTAVEKDGVVDAQGVKHEVDVIVYATGFKVGSIGSIKIVGRDGRTMEGTSVADEAMEAFLGISCAKFPNSFMLLGPNTALGHNSIIGMIETMATYITRTICEAVEADVDVVEVKQEVIDEYYEWLWPEFDKRVWKHGGCSSWYQNKDGKIFSLYPGSTYSYFSKAANAPSLAKVYNLTSRSRL